MSKTLLVYILIILSHIKYSANHSTQSCFHYPYNGQDQQLAKQYCGTKEQNRKKIPKKNVGILKYW